MSLTSFFQGENETLQSAALRFGVETALFERNDTRRQAMPFQLANRIARFFDDNPGDFIGPGQIRVLVDPRLAPPRSSTSTLVDFPAPPFNRTGLNPFPPRRILGEPFRQVELRRTVEVLIPSP